MKSSVALSYHEAKAIIAEARIIATGSIPVSDDAVIVTAWDEVVIAADHRVRAFDGPPKTDTVEPRNDCGHGYYWGLGCPVHDEEVEP